MGLAHPAGARRRRFAGAFSRAALVRCLAAALGLAALMEPAAAKEVGCRDRFGPFIEGAAVDKAGNLYAVNFDWQRAGVGRVDANTGACAPAAAAASALKSGRLPPSLNALRVLPGGALLAAAPEAKKVVLISADGKGVRDFCAAPRMVAPNDLAVSRTTGFVYISGQAWTSDTRAGDGDVWLCRKAGAPAVRLAQMGRTNGIEVSADGKYLFVSEAFNKGGTPVSNKIWRYPIKADGTLDAAGRGLAYDFGAAEGKGNIDIDGMRLDTAGALHVTRHNGGEVVVIDPMATNKALRRIPLPFSSPANLEFGGPDGKTLFVVGRCGVGTPWGTGNGCVEALRVGAPGLYWQGLQQGLPKVQT